MRRAEIRQAWRHPHLMRRKAKRFIQWGHTFVAVGADLGLLARGADALAQRFKQP